LCHVRLRCVLITTSTYLTAQSGMEASER